MPETIRISLGTSEVQESRILALLGQVYDAPEEALKEYVSNSIDAEAQNIIVDVTERRDGVVRVLDDGAGMTLEKLRTLPVAVGLSDKAELENKIGEKAIGLLAFHSLGADALTIWSRSNTSGEVNVIVFRNAEITAALNPRGVDTPDFLRASSGTVIEIGGIDDVQIRRYLTKNRLRTAFSRRFRSSIVRSGTRLVVREGDSAEPVTSQSYEGTPFYERVVNTRYGPILLELVVTPTPHRNPVEIGCKGQTVTAIAPLVADGLDPELWTSGHVAGFIDADFLTPGTGRSSFIRNRSYRQFVRSLKSVEKRLATELQQVIDAAQRKRDIAMHSQLSSAFLDAIRDLQDLGWTSFDGLVSHPAGDTTGETLAGGSGAAKRGPRRRRPRGSTRSRRPVDPQDGRGDRAVAGPVVNFEETMFALEQNHLRSSFDAVQRLVSINAGHRDYVRETSSSTGRVEYFHALLAKELTLHNWPREPADGLLERMVELSVAARRHRL